MDHPLELAAGPSNDIGIDPFQGRTKLRRIEVAVVGDPAANGGVVYRSQIAQGLVIAVMKRPTPDFPADARQRLRTGGGQEAVCEDAPTRLDPHRLSGSELVAQKVEADVRKFSIDCPPTPAAPLLAFTRLKASQTSRLRIRNGFASPMDSSRCQLAHSLG